jgi:hypothetical protein
MVKAAYKLQMQIQLLIYHLSMLHIGTTPAPLDFPAFATRLPLKWPRLTLYLSKLQVHNECNSDPFTEQKSGCTNIQVSKQMK